MESFENWRREVNIILNDTIGLSLAELAEYIEVGVKEIYDAGDDPIDAAQYAANEAHPGIDIEEIIANKLAPRIKAPGKKVRKFRVEDDR